MSVVAMQSWKKSWQTGRQRVSVEAALAIQKENVTNRLVRLREEIGHPEKEGEPLPQDQAAARAGVTVRQWQRWESGASIPYARSLSAVADAFDFDVAEFYDGPAGREPAPTPTPFAARNGADDDLADRLDAIERALADAKRDRDEHAAEIRQLLKRQEAILKNIEDSITAEKAAKAEADEARARLLAAAEVASRAYEDAARRLEATRGKQAT